MEEVAVYREGRQREQHCAQRLSGVGGLGGSVVKYIISVGVNV